MPHSLSSAPGASTVTLTPPKVIKQKRSILAMREADVDQVERSLNMTRSQMSRENADPIWAERHSQWMDIYETDAMKAYGNGTLREMVTEAGGDLDIDVVDGSMKSSVAAWYLATAHGQSDTATEVFTKLCERESPVSLS